MQKGSAERSCHVLCEQSVFREPSKTKPCTWYVALCIVLQRTPDAVGSAPVSLMGLSTNLWRKSSLYSVCAMSAMIMPKPGIGSGTGAILNLVLLGPWCEVPFFA
jgi:hypothetical protein